jgi:hypothetical protein
MVTVAEAFTDALSVSVLQGLARPQENLLGLVAQYEFRGNFTWEARRESYERIHAVRLGECPHWANLRTGVEIRNAIAHGLGTLTVRQRAEVSRWQRRFPEVGVRLDGYRIDIGPEAVQGCLRYVSGFIRWLDIAVM